MKNIVVTYGPFEAEKEFHDSYNVSFSIDPHRILRIPGRHRIVMTPTCLAFGSARHLWMWRKVIASIERRE